MSNQPSSPISTKPAPRNRTAFRAGLTSRTNSQPLHAAATVARTHGAFTGMATICPISGTLLAVTNQFASTSFAGSLNSQAHPVFALDLAAISKLSLEVARWVESTEPADEATSADADDSTELALTEQYLVLTAFLFKLGVLEVRHPIMATTKAVCKAWKYYTEALSEGIIDYIIERSANGKLITLPVLRVTADNCEFTYIAEHFKTIFATIDEIQTFSELFAATPKAPQEEALEEELTLKQQIKSILTGSEDIRFSPKLVKTVMRELVATESVSEREIYIIRKALTEDIDSLTEAELLEAREAAKTSFDIHHSAYRTHILVAIAQIEQKLQYMLKEQENLGFILLEEEQGAASDTIKYTTKTKITDQLAHVVPVTRTTTSGTKASFADMLAQVKARKLAADAGGSNG